MTKEVLAWYFAHPDERLAYGDSRPVAVGAVHEVDCVPTICEQGLHGSINVLDALIYANSSILYRVKISGEVVHGGDKLCGRRREYLARYDVEDVLRRFARRQALINIEKIKPHCGEDDYALIVRWLETGDEALRVAAESAALSALSAARSALSAARSAARSAADAAAEFAARSAAALSAARLAAWSAADAAAAAARSAAWSAEFAAWSAAALSAARLAAKEMLTEMIDHHTKTYHKALEKHETH